MAKEKDALAAWLEAAKQVGLEIPEPGDLPSGRFIVRVSRSLDARLSARAKQEGEYECARLDLPVRMPGPA